MLPTTVMRATLVSLSRRRAAVLAGSLVLLFAWAGSAARLAGAVEPGYTVLDPKSHCPIYVPDPKNPSQRVAELTAPHGEHCVQLATPDVFWKEGSNVGGGCATSLLVEEPIPPGIDDYAVVVYAKVGVGTQWKGSAAGDLGQQSMPIFNGNGTYTAPKGSRVWGLGGGNGAGPCRPEDTAQNWLSAAAWGITYNRLVSGTVTVKLSGGAPAPGITVSANCPSGGSTTTNEHGMYAFTLKTGPCTIEARVKPGATVTPAKYALNVTHDFKNVDFQVSCNALPDWAYSARDLEAALPSSSSSGGPCPLRVGVAPLEPGSMAGLAYLGKITAGTNTASSLNESPAFVRQLDHLAPLVAGKADGYLVDKCVSGCTDLLVTVTSKTTGKPINGALVDVALTPGRGTGPPYPKGVSTGPGYVCYASGLPLKPQTATPVWTCPAPPETGLTGLSTDQFGHLLLRYWSPGLIATGHVKIAVKAEIGPGCGCLGWGKTNGILTVSPNVIFHASSALGSSDTPDLERDLKQWANPPNFLDFLSNPGQFVFDLWANVTEQDVLEKLLGTVPELNTAYNIANFVKSLSTQDQQEVSFLTAVLAPLHLNPFGLGETSAASQPSQPINSGFLARIAGPPTSKAFAYDNIPLATISLSDAGTLWKLGQALKTLRYFGPDVDLQLYEVSFCEQAQATTCSQAYGQASGIQSYIYLDFNFVDKGDVDSQGNPLQFTDAFVTPYNAHAWMQAQFGAKPAPSP